MISDGPPAAPERYLPESDLAWDKNRTRRQACPLVSTGRAGHPSDDTAGLLSTREDATFSG